MNPDRWAKDYRHQQRIHMDFVHRTRGAHFSGTSVFMDFLARRSYACTSRSETCSKQTTILCSGQLITTKSRQLPCRSRNVEELAKSEDGENHRRFGIASTVELVGLELRLHNASVSSAPRRESSDRREKSIKTDVPEKVRATRAVTKSNMDRLLMR